MKICPKYCPKCRKIFPPKTEFLNCPQDSAWLEDLDSLINTTIAGKYIVVQELGQGRLGSVFSAQQKESEFVVRVLSPELTENVRHLQRFRREVGTLTKLDHAGITKAIEHGLSPRPFLVMEKAQGRALSTILKEKNRLTETGSLALFKRIAETLDYAHGVGEAHGNLTPENILLSNLDLENPEIKLINFGISKLIDQDLIFQETGELLRAPEFMSPEQFSNEVPSYEKSDIYSLGCVMYECLTGRRPFKASSYIEWSSVHRLVGPIFKDEDEFSKLGTELSNIVLRCLSKDPNHRPNAKELLAILDATSAATSSSGALGHLSTRNKLAIAVSILLLGVLIAATTFFAPKKIETRITQARADSKKAELIASLGATSSSMSVITEEQTLDTGQTAQILLPSKANSIILVLEPANPTQEIDSLCKIMASHGSIVATVKLGKDALNAASIEPLANEAIKNFCKFRGFTSEPGAGYALVMNGIELKESILAAKALAKNNEDSALELSALLLINPTIESKTKLGVAELHSIVMPVFYVLDATLDDKTKNTVSKQCISAFSYAGGKQIYYSSNRVALSSVPAYADQQVLNSLIAGFFDAHLGHNIEKEAILYSPKSQSAVSSSGELRFR